MSIKKNALAVALVAGLGMAGTAGAYLLYTAGDKTPEKIATADITSASSVVTMTQEVQAIVEPGDFILGRTSGFNVRLSLLDGAKFAAGAFAGDANLAGDNLPAGWTVTIAAGGNAGDTFVVFNVQPPSVSPVPGIVPGEIVGIDGLKLTNLTNLQTAGNQVRVQMNFIDPVGANSIGTDTSAVLESGNPVVLGCDATVGETTKRIDVGQSPTHPSKTYFSSTGEIGLLDSGSINLGSVKITKDPAFGSFSYTGTDSFTSTVSGNFGAFYAAGNDLFLSSTSNCATPITTTETYNAATNTATFTYTGTQAGVTATGTTLFLCGTVAAGNTTVIDATAVSVRTAFTRTGTPVVTGNACSLLPLQYNGSVVRVYNVNPAGNSTAQSFVRVINQSNTAGRVTIVGIDDNGVKRGPISFNLGALKSMQVNSDDLEAGNAAKGLTGSLGDGAGKWRLFVTGEFAGMAVQSLNRNATDGTVTNLTDADSRGEQLINDTFEGYTPPTP
ncbi:hypothetical protein [Lysobacter xanthus]